MLYFGCGGLDGFGCSGGVKAALRQGRGHGDSPTVVGTRGRMGAGLCELLHGRNSSGDVGSRG